MNAAGPQRRAGQTPYGRQRRRGATRKAQRGPSMASGVDGGKSGGHSLPLADTDNKYCYFLLLMICFMIGNPILAVFV
jgi:hypothetical protein